MSLRFSATYVIAALFFVPVYATFAQTADFTADATSGCFPLTVNFTDKSTGNISRWSWDFGNGNSSSLQNPSAVFAGPGVYDISLSVSGDGDINTLTRGGYIIVYDFPAATFDFDPVSGCAPLTVKFRDKTPAGSGQIIKWQWVFGDGGSSNSANPTYTYNQPGNNTVSLRVKNEFECETVKTSTTPIKALGPIVNFTPDKTAECSLPATFQFTNQTTGKHPSYQWDFGDNHNADSESPSHTYSQAGTFAVTLRATDTDGCVQSAQKTLNVGSEGGLDFTASSLKVCLGDSIVFNLLSTDAPINAKWDFGDGGKSKVNDTTYTYTNPGTYTVRLTSLLLNHTCSSVVSKTVIVAKPAEPHIKTSIDCNYNLTLTSTSLNTSRVEWYLNDDLVSGAPAFVSPVHSSGNQELRLLAFDIAGCPVELDSTVNVPVNAIAAFTPDQQQACLGASLSGCAPFLVQFKDGTVSPDPVTLLWDFGDGTSTETSGDPAHTFTTKGLYQVTLTARNPGGCTNTKTAFVIVADQAPVADFEVDKTEACAGEDVTFKDKSTNADFWCWDFGDGDQFGTNVDSVLHKYRRPGKYTVTLTAKNAGCRSTVTKVDLITVKNPLVTYSAIKTCEDPHTVNLHSFSANYDSLYWDFGDGQTSDVVNIGTHHYDHEGTYTLKLIGHNNETGCTVTAFEPITIQDIKAAFDVNTTRPCKGSPLNFTDKSHAASSWSWVIADQRYSTPDVALTFKTPGSYKAFLKVTDTDGCADSTDVDLVVLDMKGDFSLTATSTCDLFEVRFKNFSTGTPPPTVWSWDFGDGGTSFDFEPTHSYSAVGKYTVDLSVTNTDGTCTYSKVDAINFTVPIPAFQTAKEVFCPGEVVIAANETKNAVSYLWDYGDGRRADFVSPSILYDEPGSYDLTLFAKDAYGCERKLEKENIVTIEKPAADFSVRTSSADCPPFTGNFTDLSVTDIQQWNWIFGDGHTSTVQDPANVYLEPGTFTVTLTVTDNHGCTDTKVIDRLVNVGGPSGSFSPDGINSCTNKEVGFTAITTNATRLRWDYGDGVVDDMKGNHTSHVYTKAGDYIPSLSLTDSRGCETVATGSSTITVRDTTAVVSHIAPVCIHKDEPFNLIGENADGLDSLLWSWGIDGISAGDGNNFTAAISEPGLHYVHGYALNKYTCTSNTVDSVRILGPITMIPNVITPNGDAANETFRIIGLDNSVWNIDIVNRWGSLVYRKENYKGEWSADGQPAGVYYYILRSAICGDASYKGYISVAK